VRTFWIKTNAWWLIGADGIVLWPFVFFKAEKYLWKDNLYRHELEHCYQIQRMGLVKFYATWIWERLRYGYKNIRIEKDAWLVQRISLTEEQIMWRRNRKVKLPPLEDDMGRKVEKKGFKNFVLKYLGLIIAAGIIIYLAFFK